MRTDNLTTEELMQRVAVLGENGHAQAKAQLFLLLNLYQQAIDPLLEATVNGDINGLDCDMCVLGTIAKAIHSDYETLHKFLDQNFTRAKGADCFQIEHVVLTAWGETPENHAGLELLRRWVVEFKELSTVVV